MSESYTLFHCYKPHYQVGVVHSGTDRDTTASTFCFLFLLLCIWMEVKRPRLEVSFSLKLRQIPVLNHGIVILSPIPFPLLFASKEEEKGVPS